MGTSARLCNPRKPGLRRAGSASLPTPSTNPGILPSACPQRGGRIAGAAHPCMCHTPSLPLSPRLPLPRNTQHNAAEAGHHRAACLALLAWVRGAGLHCGIHRSIDIPQSYQNPTQPTPPRPTSSPHRAPNRPCGPVPCWLCLLPSGRSARGKVPLPPEAGPQGAIQERKGVRC